jgi:hypothetical protein
VLMWLRSGSLGLSPQDCNPGIYQEINFLCFVVNLLIGLLDCVHDDSLFRKQHKVPRTGYVSCLRSKVQRHLLYCVHLKTVNINVMLFAISKHVLIPVLIVVLKHCLL